MRGSENDRSMRRPPPTSMPATRAWMMSWARCACPVHPCDVESTKMHHHKHSGGSWLQALQSIRIRPRGATRARRMSWARCACPVHQAVVLLGVVSRSRPFAALKSNTTFRVWLQASGIRRGPAHPTHALVLLTALQSKTHLQMLVSVSTEPPGCSGRHD